MKTNVLAGWRILPVFFVLTLCAQVAQAQTITNPPLIISPLVASGTVGVPFSYLISAAGDTPIVFTVSSLPPGLGFNGSAISGTPTQGGVFQTDLTASNDAGTDTKLLTISITEDVTGTVPTITSPLTVNTTVGAPFTYTLTATGSAPIAYGVSGLPAGLIFSGDTINGTPTVPGSANAVLTATNEFGSDTEELIILISAPSEGPAFTSAPAASGTVGQEFSFALAASGTPPIAFSVANLPPGLSFTGNTIGGVPTTTGTTAVTLIAQGPGGSASSTLTITINAGGSLTGTWTGRLQTKLFDQTGTAARPVSKGAKFTLTLVQGQALTGQTTIQLAGLTLSFDLSGPLGNDNFWLSGADSASGTSAVLMGQVLSKGRKLKGTGTIYGTFGAAQATFSLTPAK